jgi:hypothetical protein
MFTEKEYLPAIGEVRASVSSAGALGGGNAFEGQKPFNIRAVRLVSAGSYPSSERRVFAATGMCRPG